MPAEEEEDEVSPQPSVAKDPPAAAAEHQGAASDDPPSITSTNKNNATTTLSSDASDSLESSSASTSSSNNTNNNTSNDDDDDVTSKAAVALAAVAAAATANHKSPAEAAAQARAVAHSLLTTKATSASDGDTAWRRVQFTALQTQLALRMDGHSEESPALQSMVHAIQQNRAFLQQLLLLEYFYLEEEPPEATVVAIPKSTTATDKDTTPKKDDPPEETMAAQAFDPEEAMAILASERLLSLLKKIEGAYHSLLNLLPRRRKHSSLDDVGLEPLGTARPDHRPDNDHTLDNSDDGIAAYETPVVVPDLLPPCTTANGDATLAFFKACTIREEAAASAAVDTQPPPESDSERAASKNTMAASTSATSSKSMSAMFGSMFKRTNPSKTASSSSSTILSSFRRKSKVTEEEDVTETASTMTENDQDGLRPGEYAVKIEREMLGLTVENVLERTVVRTVLAGGPAKKAGAKVGSLIVKVGNVETKNLTHFETIDELRQSQRPLLLVLKQLSEESLRSAREEMGRLIRGAGYGAVIDGNVHHIQTSRPPHETAAKSSPSDQGSSKDNIVRPLIAADLRLEAYSSYLKQRLAIHPPRNNNPAATTAPSKNKKAESVLQTGEKLIWILTLLVYGLERECLLLGGDSSSDSHSQQPVTSHLRQHTLKQYSDAANSAAKVLLDFTRKRIDPNVNWNLNTPVNTNVADPTGARRRKGAPPPPPPPIPGRGNMKRGGRRGNSMEDSSVAHEKPLLQIGDVLQRTRTFLADTTSPPAALLRGEVISVLCDILDVDTEMELSEEESASATSGGGQATGAINDLGSAGSLLKLIVLNCPIMKSPSCEGISSFLASGGGDPDELEELKRRLGKKESFTADEIHRLHAGNRFLAVVHRLAASRSMSARITACSLGTVLWSHLSFPHQLQLRGVITRALHDVEVLVRKATASVLHEIAELVFDPRCVPWLVLMSERAMTDPEPQLRSAAMTLTWHLAEHLPNAFLGDASQGSRYLRRLPDRNDPIFADVYLLQCKFLPVATRLAEDRSPSVRLAVAAQCDRLCDALGDHWSSVVIDVLLGLLSDPDERVRCEAVMCVPRLAGIVLLSSPPGASVSEVSILEALVPASIRLQKDAVAVVRVALASAAGELLTLLVALQGKADEPHEHENAPESFKRYKKQVDERLIPLVQTLLNDKDPEVTSAALRAVTNASRKSSHVPTSRARHHSVASEDDSASVTSMHSHASRENRQPVFLPVLSEIQVLRLLPTLTELANSKQWRVRQSAVEIVPALLGCTQKLETRTEISKLCVRLMADRVDEVRRTAAECLCMGGSSLGSHGEEASSEWFQRIVIPCIRDSASHVNSKQRLLSLKMVEIILLNGACPTKWKPAEGEESERKGTTPMNELISIALSLCGDRIANVRLNVGRVLETVLHMLGTDELTVVAQAVGEQLTNEQAGGRARDVMFFATKCSSRAKQLLDEGTERSSDVL